MGSEISDKKLYKMLLKYQAALKILETQIDIINNDFKYVNNYTPIEHVKTRIKSLDSIKRKLEKKGLDLTVKNIENNISDVAGARIVCSFLEDVNELVDIIRKSELIEIVKEKDYIANPKPSGYRSYHIVVLVPVKLSSGNFKVCVEIQVRTLAMDLWASLEHKLSYKSNYCTNDIKKRLYEISDELDEIDNEMADLVEAEHKLKLSTRKNIG